MKPISEHVKAIDHTTEPIVIHVAKNGTDLGKIQLSVVHSMIAAEQLTKTDHYFDPSAQQWVTLESHPELC